MDICVTHDRRSGVGLCLIFTNFMSVRRLLYRGALSLPDSHLLLDGLTFTGHAANDASLLQNPLALALESMRGRPTLRFLGVRKLNPGQGAAGDGGWVDFSGRICLCVSNQSL